MNLLELYCHVDDFVTMFMPEWRKQLIEENKVKRNRVSRLSVSEMMTILIHFHQSHYRDFKSYYLLHVSQHLGTEFPNLLSYQRFVALIPTVFAPLCAYLQSQRTTTKGIAFIDQHPLLFAILSEDSRLSCQVKVCDFPLIGQSRLKVRLI
jgi:hypothetical protein